MLRIETRVGCRLSGRRGGVPGHRRRAGMGRGPLPGGPLPPPTVRRAAAVHPRRPAGERIRVLRQDRRHRAPPARAEPARDQPSRRRLRPRPLPLRRHALDGGGREPARPDHGHDRHPGTDEGGGRPVLADGPAHGAAGLRERGRGPRAPAGPAGERLRFQSDARRCGGRQAPRPYESRPRCGLRPPQPCPEPRHRRQRAETPRQRLAAGPGRRRHRPDPGRPLGRGGHLPARGGRPAHGLRRALRAGGGAPAPVVRPPGRKRPVTYSVDRLLA